MSESSTTTTTTKSAAAEEIWRLWGGKAPGAVGDEPADVPTLTVYRPQKPDGSAVIVCPGGAYQMLADHEGPVIARWLATEPRVLKRCLERYIYPLSIQFAMKIIFEKVTY